MRFELFQNVVDILRNKFIYFHFYNKKDEEYENLILGSSHMLGIDFGENALNCAFSSCDMYYTNEIYKLFNKPEVKNVIISFSVFSPGYSLIRTFDAHICATLKSIFGIPYQNEEVAKKKHLKFLEFLFSFKLKKYYETYEPKVSNAANQKHEFQVEKIQQRALKHLKNNQRDVQQYYILEDLLKATQNNHQNLYIILPPATHYFKDVLPSSDILFKGLYPITDKYNHCTIINLYDSEEFTLEDFSDGDHLNPEGKKKLTDKVFSCVENNVKKDEDMCNAK